MKIFVIDSANRVKAHPSRKTAHQGSDGPPFATEKEFASVSADWPTPRLIAIWNKLPGATPVRKFRDRGTALRRIWEAIQLLTAGASTKTELVIGLLTRPSGATLQQIIDATGWQAHTVRAFICTKPQKQGLKAKSFKDQGERVYRIRPKTS